MNVKYNYRCTDCEHQVQVKMRRADDAPDHFWLMNVCNNPPEKYDGYFCNKFKRSSRKKN